MREGRSTIFRAVFDSPRFRFSCKHHVKTKTYAVLHTGPWRKRPCRLVVRNLTSAPCSPFFRFAGIRPEGNSCREVRRSKPWPGLTVLTKALRNWAGRQRVAGRRMILGLWLVMGPAENPLIFPGTRRRYRDTTCLQPCIQHRPWREKQAVGLRAIF